MTIKITSKNLVLFSIFAATLATSFSASATVYKWRDARGKVQYSDKPPSPDAAIASPAEIVNALQSKELCVKPDSKVKLSKAEKKSVTTSQNFFGVGVLTPLTQSAAKSTTSAMSSVNKITNISIAATSTSTVKVATTPTATTPTATTPAATTPAATTPAATTPAATTPAATTPAATTPAAMQNTSTTSSNLVQVGLMPTVNLSKQMAPAVGFSTLRVVRTIIKKNGPRPAPAGGEFRTSCTPSHMSNDDPLVYPNQQGAAHHHTFFGNTSINYKTNLYNLSSIGNSTCAGGIMNRTGYWVPSIIDTTTNTPIKPINMVVYYKTTQPEYVIAPPKGLRMLTGNSKATSKSTMRPNILIRFSCLGGKTPIDSDTIPKCSSDTTILNILMSFPTCWDGVNLDSPDHFSHMATGVPVTPNTPAGCPASHPIRIPDIAYNLHYLVTPSDNTAKWRLASDNYAPVDGQGGYSMHGDWVNGWDEKFINIFVKNCLRARSDCGGYLLGDGTIQY